MAELFFSLAQWALSGVLLLAAAIVLMLAGVLLPKETGDVTADTARSVVFFSILGVLLLVAGVTVSHL